MALLLIVGLYALEIWGMSLASQQGLHPEAKFLLAILSLFLPIVIYTVIDRSLTVSAVNRIGKEWCATNGAEFVLALHFRSHFSIVHKQDGKTKRKKFSLVFVPTTWKVKQVHWL